MIGSGAEFDCETYPARWGAFGDRLMIEPYALTPA
ncbi:hypothetical protein SAMN04490220_0683 [Rhodococcus jostii]|uniref:Uncharacterized protein n=1 Tax=Rhodococcus jostii TaxID=132919 RepID=A0A1H4J903_RHOJO|nr:hypothetical protein SAMN04490220_0683 [Rhodococcus jostii]